MLTSLFRVAVGLPLAVLGVALSTASNPALEASPDPGKDHAPVTAIHLDRDGEKWAVKTLRKMSTEEKIGQLIMPWARVQFLNSKSPEYLVLRENLRKYHVGGFAVSVPVEGSFLMYNEPYGTAGLTNQLQNDSELPLIFAADFERGLSMRLRGTTVFPHAMAFGAAGKLEYAEALGRITAQESRAIGIHWNFFPVADVNSNPANPIINTRSFGEDPQQVGNLLSAYIRGAHAAGMLTTAKHFPGHGDTGTDSHLGVAQVKGSADHLDLVEMPPFRQAIQGGIDAIMVAHISVPSLDPDPRHVATTSPKVIKDLLRKKLGFQGIVLTDALDMGALTRLYAKDPGRSCVDAFKAGNDVLLIPLDIGSCFRSLAAAVHSGEIPNADLDASVLKLLRAKASLGLHKKRLVDPTFLPDKIAAPENLALGQLIANDAVTLLRDTGKMLPLQNTSLVAENHGLENHGLENHGTDPPPLPYQTVETTANHLVAVVLTDDVRLEWGRVLERELRARVPDANVIFVDQRIAKSMSAQVLSAVDEAQAVVAAVYISPSGGKRVMTKGQLTASVGLADAAGSLLQQILARAPEKTFVVALGSPYFVSDFPETQNYLCTFSNTSVSETSAVRALFGEIAIHGRMPVSIPSIAPRGAGLDRPATLGGMSHGQR
jgi:beta-N-acetylhexosaminidase